MTAKSWQTSFFALTQHDQDEDKVVVERIEIPLFQRDYAQGRDSDQVGRIRTDFLDALHRAVAGNESASVALDFVYGGVDDGTLRPLDGQQRLTTLFLLHWYVASRSGHLADDHGWKHFSYATRQSARMFCESLVTNALPDGRQPSDWIRDEPWYMFIWKHDPTIKSMLVMLDAIHERFLAVDPAVAWARLTDAAHPAISFLLLPLSSFGSTGDGMRPEALYIKMNSRGKPLTEFENFKAHFEKTIQWSPRAHDFAYKVDTVWSDLLWHLRGDNDLIDDEFLRYMEFVTEVCEWREGRADGSGQRLGNRAQLVFGPENPRREEHLEFLLQAFDIWVGRSIPKVFEDLFSSSDDAECDVSKVRLFFRSDSTQQPVLNLFEACCRSYGDTRGRARVFSLGQSLLLYAVVLHLVEDTNEFPRRIRILRNLMEASSDQVRAPDMPKILEDVHRVVRDGTADAVTTLNQSQVKDEKLKAVFLDEHPHLQSVVFELEDHELLRGSLGAFEFDAAVFETRAVAFHLVMSLPEHWTDLLGALLACGEYQRQRRTSRPFLFGTDSKRHDSAWRDLLTGATRDALQPTRQVLATFLDRLATSTPATLAAALKTIATEYLGRCATAQRFDWRYYMVKYHAMREQGSSTYFAENYEAAEHLAMGYSLCMLRAGGASIGGNHRDPYLLAIARELEDGVVEDAWFAGYEDHPRWLALTRSGTSIRCTPAGFELAPPPLHGDAGVFATVCAELGVGEDGRVAIQQAAVEGRHVDTEDRIQRGAEIVRMLAAAGL